MLRGVAFCNDIRVLVHFCNILNLFGMLIVCGLAQQLLYKRVQAAEDYINKMRIRKMKKQRATVLK